ncbi:MAG: FAD-dependent oxidoreductase [Candidatus Cardinium sp.]|nr:FAD-dependent oxidoreductase [Candidatus Cardinium sp.]
MIKQLPIKIRLAYGSMLMGLYGCANYLTSHDMHKPEIRKIIPPSLQSEDLGNAICCYRPSRLDGPNISIAEKNQKVIVHNYGHETFGWSLAPGSAQYIVDLLVNQAERWGLQKDTPIALIGAGALGLYTAYYLQKRGYTHITIIAEHFDHITSCYAGALFIPPLATAVASIDPAVLSSITIDSYWFYKAIACKAHSDFKEGAKLLPAYFKNEMANYEPLVHRQIIQPPQPVIVDFNNGVTRALVAYDESLFIDVAVMLSNLYDFLKKQPNITFESRKITLFNDIHEKFIFNCSGLGAIALNDDHDMVSTQGHLIMLNNQIPSNLNYILSIPMGEGKTAAGQLVQYLFEFYPKHLKHTDSHSVGAVGGTIIKGATKATPNKEQFPIILRHAKAFFYGGV